MAASEQELHEARRWVVSCLLGSLVLLGVGIRFAPWTPPPAHTQPPPPSPPPQSVHPTSGEVPEQPETPPNPSLPLWPFFVPGSSK